MAAHMKAVLIKDGKGNADALYIGDHERPRPKSRDVLVKVKAFGINRMDIMQREGKYPLPPQAPKDIMGVEFSGTVVERGSDAKRWQVDDKVFGLAYGGAYAEYLAVDEEMIMHKPQELDWIQAASLPEAWFTAFQALNLVGELETLDKGRRVLIHAGASGVGIAAIQIAKLENASQIIATAGSSEKLQFLKTVGATHVINYKQEDFAKRCEEITEGQGVDFVLDLIGASYWEQNLTSLGRDGRMVMLGLIGGAQVESTNIGPIIYKRLRIQGTTLRSRSPEYQRHLRMRFEKELLPKIVSDHLKVVVHKSFDWKEIKSAHDEMENSGNLGKIVCVIDG